MKLPLLLLLALGSNLTIIGVESSPSAVSQSSSPKEFTHTSIRTASLDEVKAWLKKDKKGCYLMSQFNILMSRPSTLAELDDLYGKKSHEGVGGAYGWLVSDHVFIVDDVSPESIDRGDMLYLPFVYGHEGAWYLNHRIAHVHYSQLK